MITAYATPKLAVEAIKAGAIDYLAKPFAPEELLHAVARCAERHRFCRKMPPCARAPAKFISSNKSSAERPKIRELRQLDPDRCADQRDGVDPRRKRHRQGIDRGRAAQPESAAEGQLRPHQLRGDSRDASGKRTVRPRKRRVYRRASAKAGRVEEADGGTIFLDEIGDMSRPLQAKLLRFLEDGTFTRVGGNQELRVDVRLIAATNRDIIDAIRQNQFREDLFHRLNVVQFRPPPLRERGQDVILLAEHFLQAFHGDDESADQRAISQNGAAAVAVPSLAGQCARIAQRDRAGGDSGNCRRKFRPRSLPDFQLETGCEKAIPTCVLGRSFPG